MAELRERGGKTVAFFQKNDDIRRWIYPQMCYSNHIYDIFIPSIGGGKQLVYSYLSMLYVAASGGMAVAFPLSNQNKL